MKHDNGKKKEKILVCRREKKAKTQNGEREKKKSEKKRKMENEFAGTTQWGPEVGQSGSVGVQRGKGEVEGRKVGRGREGARVGPTSRKRGGAESGKGEGGER